MKMIYLLFILLINISYGVTGFFASSSGIKLNSFSITEGSSSFSVDFNVSLDSNTSEANLTCEFADISTNGNDFVHSSLPINFNIGEQYKSASFQINGDTIYEDNETFTMILKDGNSTLDELNVTIINDDNLPSISFETNSTIEGTTSTIYIKLSNQSDKNISVDINSTHIDTNSNDFSAINQTLIFASLETIKEITITTIDDNIYENNESFKLKLSNEKNATISSSEKNFIIIENEPIPTVTISNSGNSKREDSGSDIKFTFNLSPKSKFDTNISLDINQTFIDWFLIAKNGLDYTLSINSINVASNTNQAEVNISIINDSYYEFNETIRLNLNLIGGEANISNEYIEANITQDSDPELIVSQSLTDGTDLNNIFVTDMVEFNVSVYNNSDYNMSNVRIWNDFSISFEKNDTTLSNGILTTYKVDGQANGYMFDIDSLKKGETKYLFIDVNVTEPTKVFSLTDATINYTKLNDYSSLHPNIASDDIFRVSDFENSALVDTNFTNSSVNIEYLNYTKNSFNANVSFKAKQYLMDIKVIKDTNITESILKLTDALNFTIDITNEYTLPNKIATGLLLRDSISDALILPNPLDGIANLYGYYIVDLDNLTSKSLSFDTTPKQSGNIAGIYSTTLNCAEILTTYNKRFFDFNLSNNIDCVDLNDSSGLLIEGNTTDKIKIYGYEFDECNFNNSGSTTHPHVTTSIENATLSTGKSGLDDGMGGKYCFGAKIDSSTYIVVNDVLNERNGTFDTISQLTLTNWFYPTNLNNPNDERVILSRRDSYYLTVTETGTNNDKLNFYIHKDNFSQSMIDTIDMILPSGSSDYLVKSGDYYDFIFETTINPNNWYYLGFFYDGNTSNNLTDIMNDYNFSDPSTFPSCNNNDPLFCAAGSGNSTNILIRFCNKTKIGQPISQNSYFHRNLDNFTNQLVSGHQPLFCGTESGYSGDTMQLYLVQEDGTLQPSTNPFANFLPKELISDIEDLYVYRDYNGKSGITGYAENVEIYYNEANNTIIINNFDIYTNPNNSNYKDDENKSECRLCGASNPQNYATVFDRNVTGSALIIGDSILTSNSGLTKNDSAQMSRDDSNSKDDLSIGERLEINADSEILFAKLYWQGAILFDTATRYIKERYSPDRNLSAYKNISFYKDNTLIPLTTSDINCSWFRPAKYVYQAAKPVTYNCTNNRWYSPTGDISSSSKDRVCLDELVKIDATDATGSARLMGLEEALYYQCSYEFSEQKTNLNLISPNTTYKVTDILTTISSAGAYSSVGGTFGGWALAVAYDNNAKDFKRVTIFDGFRALGNSDRIKNNFTFSYPFYITDFQTPNDINDMNMSLLLFASEGDKTHLGDEISIDFRYGNSYTNYYASDKLDSTLDEIFSTSYLGVDIDNIPITVTDNNYLIESNISLNIKVDKDITEADNYFLGSLGFSANLDERNCYEQYLRVYRKDGVTIEPSSTTYIDGINPIFSNSTYELTKGDIIYLKVTTKNKGFYSNYISLNTLIEDDSSLEFLCIANQVGNCIDNNDSQYILSDNNLTIRVGNDKSLNSGGLLLNNNQDSFYIKAKVLEYKNGHNYEINHDQYRYRDDNITTLKEISKCSSSANYQLGFEDLNLYLNAWFTPSQVFPTEDSTLTIRVKNNSSFEAEDVNLTVAFTNLSNYFGINDLADINNSITTPPKWSYQSYVNSGNKTIVYFRADKNLTKADGYFDFKFNIKSPNKGGLLKTTSTLNAPMIVASPKTINKDLTILDLKAEYRFDECYLGSRGDGTTPMVVVDNARGEYNATAYDSNTTDSANKICRAGNFSENSSNDYLLLNENSVNGTNVLSISFWMKTNSSNKQTILSGANNVENNELTLLLDGNYIKIYRRGEEKSFDVSSEGINLNDNNWHHIVWTRSYRNNYIYVDKTKIEDNKQTSSSKNSNINISSDKFILGQSSGFDIAQDLEGYIDELKFFKTSLSSSTITRIYDNESNGRNPSNDSTSRSCQICYPSKYSFFSDGKGICGDKSGEDVNLTLLNSDNSQFEFIAPNDSRVNYNSIYPTLAYFDLNISSGVNDSNITFGGVNYDLTSPIRVDGNETFKFYNPCKNGSGDKCSDSTTVNFNVENTLQSPAVGAYTIENSGSIDFTLVDRVMNFKRNSTNYSGYPKKYNGIEQLMDNLAQSYDFYMEFNESETGKEITISDSSVTDSVNYYNLIETGYDTASTLTDSVVAKKSITFKTPSEKLGLSKASIKVENSENFCVDGTYSIEIFTKPDSFKLDLDSKVLYLTENYEFLTETTLKYDDNLTLNIIPICNSATCSNHLKNLNNFMGNDVTTYYTQIKSRVKNSSTTVDIDINATTGSDHHTEWDNDGNFTKLYFNSNSLDSTIAYSNRNEQLIDLNFTVEYFRLYDRSVNYSNSAYGGAIYGGGIPAKYVKGPDHVVATLTCDYKCGKSCKVTISPKDENNNTIEWSNYQVELTYSVGKGIVTVLPNPAVRTPAGSADTEFYLTTTTSNCCTNSEITISDIRLLDPSGNLVNTLTNKYAQYEANSLDKAYGGKIISFDCPAYSFIALENITSIQNDIVDRDVTGVDENLTTKISNTPFSLILVSYWDENNTLIDFPIKLDTSLLDRTDNGIIIFSTNDVDLGNIGRGDWTNIDVGLNSYRDLIVRMREDGNASHFNDSDPFAIRPNNFNIRLHTNTLSINDKVDITSFRAGDEFNMSLSVTDSSNNIIINYDEKENTNRSFTIDANLTHNGIFTQNDLDTGDDFNYAGEASLAFNAGQVANIATNFSEVGRYEVNITDANGSYHESITSDCSSCAIGSSCINKDRCPYACIDIIDDSCTGLSVINSASDIITITPYKYTITRRNFIVPNYPAITSNMWVYMANINDLNVVVDASILAKNKVDVVTRNFTYDIFNAFNSNYPDIINVDADINFTINNPSNQLFEINATKRIQRGDLILLNEVANNFLHSDDTNLTPFYNLTSNTHFAGGEANITYAFNINRKSSVALNPVNFQMNDINTSNDTSTITGFISAEHFGYNGLANENVSFYYGRVATPIDTEFDISNLSEKAFEFKVEVYLKDPTNYDFANLTPDKKLNHYKMFWYQNQGDSSSKIKNIRAMKDSLIDSNIAIEGLIGTDVNDTNVIPPSTLVFNNGDTGRTELKLSNFNNLSKYPYTVKFFLDVEEYLWFDRNSPYPYNGGSYDPSRQPNFTVTFKKDDDSGEGVNQNIGPSGMTKRRIDW